MKRSDAVKQLKYWLHGASNNPNHQNEAKSLLNKIIDMGFLPPERTYQQTIDKHFYDVSYKSVETTTDHSWEPEFLGINDSESLALIDFNKNPNNDIQAYCNMNKERYAVDTPKEEFGKIQENLPFLDYFSDIFIKTTIEIMRTKRELFIEAVGEDLYNKVDSSYRQAHIKLENEFIAELNDITKRGW